MSQVSIYRIPFNKPGLTGSEFHYMSDAARRGHLSGDGYYTREASSRIEEMLGVRKALLTTSCTHALEMSALLLNIQPFVTLSVNLWRHRWFIPSI